MEHNRVAVRFILDELAPVRPDVAFVIHGSCSRQFTDVGRPPNVFVDTDPFTFDDDAVTGFVGINPVTTDGGALVLSASEITAVTRHLVAPPPRLRDPTKDAPARCRGPSLLLRYPYAMFASNPDARSAINAPNAATREECKV